MKNKTNPGRTGSKYIAINSKTGDMFRGKLDDVKAWVMYALEDGVSISDIEIYGLYPSQRRQPKVKTKTVVADVVFV